MASSKASNNPPSNRYSRIVVLVDMDCFYCQVEEKLNPELKGKPIAVVQYNAWRGGGIIAVNYPARAKGVTRHMRGDEAKTHCPSIELVRVPSVREKADLSKYREAGKEVAAVLQTFTPLLERASVDEAYLDITELVNQRLKAMNQGKYRLEPNSLKSTYAVGYDNIGDFIKLLSAKIGTDDPEENFDGALDELSVDDVKAMKNSDIKLLIGATIVDEIRAAVKEKTGYECSAGIAHNKILAKQSCGINKPNKQTLLPLKHVSTHYRTLPLTKVTGLGGKFGEDVCETMKIKTMAELSRFTLQELQSKFDEKNGQWLYLIGKGIDMESVTPRYYSKSIGCCKKFPGRNAITGVKTLKHWFGELSKEIAERLEQDALENNRKPKQMTVSYVQVLNGQDVSSSRSVALPSVDADEMAEEALNVLQKNTEKFFKNEHGMLNNAIKFLGISVGKFEAIEKCNRLQKMFNKQKKISEDQRMLGNMTLVENSVDDSENISKDIFLDKSNDVKLKPNLPTVNEMRNRLQDMFENQKVNYKENKTVQKLFRNLSDIPEETVLKIQSPEKKNPLIGLFKNHSISEKTTTETSKLPTETETVNRSRSSLMGRFLRKFKDDSKSTIGDTGSPEVSSSSDASPISKKTKEIISVIANSMDQEFYDDPSKKVEDDIDIFLKLDREIEDGLDHNENIFNESKLEAEISTESSSVSPNESDTADLNNEHELEDESSLAAMQFKVDKKAPLIKSFFVQRMKEKHKEVKRRLSMSPTAASSQAAPPQRSPLKRAYTQNFNDAFSEANKPAAPDYKSTYAEYFRAPAIELCCFKCNKLVPEHEFQCHQDYHYAVEVSQSQRQEFRSEISQRFENRTPPTKKSKKMGEHSKNNLSIDRYLLQKDRSAIVTPKKPTQSLEDSALGNLCPLCAEFVTDAEVAEHTVFHSRLPEGPKLNTAFIERDSKGDNGGRAKKKQGPFKINKFFDSK